MAPAATPRAALHTEGAKTGCGHEHHQHACVVDCTQVEDLGAVAKPLTLEKRCDPLVDLGMPGRIGMRLLLDSRVVNVPMAYSPTFVTASSLKPFFFNGLQNA